MAIFRCFSMTTIAGLLFLAASLGGTPPPCFAQSEPASYMQINQMLRSGENQKAVAAATLWIERDSNDVTALYLRSVAYDQQQEFSKAIADLDQMIKLNPDTSSVYQTRGLIHFKNGQAKESVLDFDRFLKSQPQHEPAHWQRGISYYYTKEYEKGVRQFRLYQPVGPTDVENAIWHFLCNAGEIGVKKAQGEIIEVKGDRRPWAMSVYQLFQGKLTPDQVIKIVNEKSRSKAELSHNLFYAHLYVGLFYDVQNRPQEAKAQIEIACKDHMITHYMGDVARVHLLIREREAKNKTKMPK